MVFLRPVVVRDGAATDALSMDRYDMMRTRQQQAQPASSSLIPVNESPVLPMLTPGLPTSIAAPNFKTPIPQVQPPPPPMTGR